MGERLSATSAPTANSALAVDNRRFRSAREGVSTDQLALGVMVRCQVSTTENVAVFPAGTSRKYRPAPLVDLSQLSRDNQALLAGCWPLISM